MKPRRTLLVRTGHGSAGVSSVPGLPELPPDQSAAGPAQAPVPPPMPLDPPDLPPVAAPTAVLPVVPDLVTGPVRPAIPDPPAQPPAVPAAALPEQAWPEQDVRDQTFPQQVLPEQVLPQQVLPDQVLPQQVLPEQGLPEPASPEPAAPPAAPSFRPLFADAPNLNWTGPGDSWSRAWAVQSPAAGGPAPAALGSDAGSPAELPPTARDIELIRASLAVVEPVADRATAHFYALIFLHHPEVRALFPAAMDVQRDRLFRALLAAARGADDPEALRAHLGALGRGHRRYGTLTGHYGPVGECLVQALARYAGSRWDAATELAWRRVYRLVSSIMIEAAEEAARTSPPWWHGEVVRHERRTRDVAVITVRPDQAYPFRAGQYTSLETPWWPRVWRHYSFASAPRPDGLLTFHVKAVQAGWVSNALVHRAAPGDVLRLGPAAGAMTVDHGCGTDLLCLGGGTGIAPVKAVIEEVAEHGGPRRRVDVFYGARRAAELYELDGLRELAGRCPWLTVRAVVSGAGPVGGALAGELPEVVGRFGPWSGREALLSGPAAMVRRSVAALVRSGVPVERIRHDLVGDVAAG